MTLVLCPDCRADVSSHAASCPRCGCPISTADLPAPQPGAKPPRPKTFISRRFATLWTLGTGALWVLLLAIGSEPGSEEPLLITATIALGASLIPIWWRSRRAARLEAAPGGAELERRIDERLEAAEEQFRRRLAELEDSGRQMMELEERIDFAERLLTKYRDDQLPGS